MSPDKYGKAILERMYNHKYIGGRHTSLDSLKRGFAPHEKKNVEKSIKKLVKANLVLSHPTGYGRQYSVNPAAIGDVEKMIKDDACV